MAKTQPCAAQVIRSTRGRSACPERDKPWVLAAAVLGSTMAFVDESVVNVALPTIEADLGTTLAAMQRSEEHTAELQSQSNLVCRLLLEKKKHTMATGTAANASIACPLCGRV